VRFESHQGEFDAMNISQYETKIDWHISKKREISNVDDCPKLPVFISTVEMDSLANGTRIQNPLA
jgi:hypothetical protein